MLFTSGCIQQSGPDPAPDPPQAGVEESAEVEETEAAGSESAEPEEVTVVGAEAGMTQTPGQYDSTDGWMVKYDPELISVTEADGKVDFTYTGACEGENRIEVTYYAGQQDQEALYNVMAGPDGLPEHERSEGYFGTGSDVWALRTSVKAEENGAAVTKDYTALEHNDGALVIEILRHAGKDEMAEQLLDDTFADLMDSFTLTDHAPQKAYDYVPGRYAAVQQEEIEGEESSAVYYVQLNADHTGVVSMQDEVPVIWYNRDGKLLSAETNEQIYEYTIEGDMLYLLDGENTFEFQKEAAAAQIDYSDESNWAYYAIGEDKPVDLFLIAPTVDTTDEMLMDLGNEELKKRFVGALNMERGIFEDTARMFSPFYRQISIRAYEASEQERKQYADAAYADVSDAFRYYLDNINDGRPIIIAGFSQGAELSFRLLEEYFGDEALQKQLVAVYAPGWRCTKAMVEQYPQIVPAQGEDDTGVVICFDCEAPGIDGSIIVPWGTWTYSINPLNWKTDSTPADKSLNLGACFVGYDGVIEKEIPNLCGCYIDEERGTLKVPDVSPGEYEPGLAIFQSGGYHLYDYQFFYRNLQENVKVRTEAYLNSQ